LYACALRSGPTHLDVWLNVDHASSQLKWRNCKALGFEKFIETSRSRSIARLPRGKIVGISYNAINGPPAIDNSMQ
jgi:hypothetical protein